MNITRLDIIQRRGTVEDYLFRVSNSESDRDVAVGIPEQAYLRVGESKKPREVWYGLAEAWLKLQMERGFNPFRESSDRVPDVPTAVADHWIGYGELPPML